MGLLLEAKSLQVVKQQVAVVVVEQAVGLAVGQVEAKSLLEAAALALLLAQCRSPMV